MAGASQGSTSGYDRHRRADEGPERPDFDAEEFKEMLKAAREVLGEPEPTGSASVVSSSELPSGFREGELASLTASTAAVALPEFVNQNGRIDGNLIRSFLINPENREHTSFSPSREINYLTDEAMFPIIVWASGKQPNPGQSRAEYFVANTNAEKNLGTFTTAAGNDFAEPFLKALEQLHLPATKFRKIPVDAKDINEQKVLTVAEVVRLDPVNSCQFLLRQQSPNDGYGIYTFGAALVEFRGIMNLS